MRYKPLGLLYDGRWVYCQRLYANESLALRDNFWGVDVAPTASPALVRAGPYVEFQPAAIWGVWTSFQYVQYFGNFNLVQGFSGAQSEFSDATIAQNGATAAQATNDWEWTLGRQFNLKVKDIVIRNATRVVRGSLSLRDMARVYYDQFYDILAPNNGWFFTNDLDVLHQTAYNHLVVGAGFNNPTVFLLIQWWAEHRYLTGLETSSFLPLIALGFQTTGDFLPVAGPH